MSFTIKLTDISTLETEGMMASTLHFNIMCVWVEHNIPITTSQDFWIVDPFWVNKLHGGLYRQIFRAIPPYPKLLFVPTIYKNHWSLYTIVNFVGHNLGSLRGGIIYMDRFGVMAVEEITGVVLEAVKIVWGEWYREEEIPTGPINVMKCPLQPNATDCGFYIMHCIQRIYEELLSGSGGAQLCVSTLSR
jgi:hypothetical protein